MGNRLGVDLSGSLVRVANVSVTATENERHRGPPAALREYLKDTTTWGEPWAFCFNKSNCVCFMVDWANAKEALEAAAPFLSGQGVALQLLGSRAADFAEMVHQTPGLENLNLQFHREISCVLEAIDLLLCEAPTAFFKFSKTSSALNTSLSPKDEDYEAVPLTREESSNFYPYLLVNLKGGVSFHKVTGPNESKRVGGSTIGGGTFVGLLRLLLPDLDCSLDAFLMAQEGDVSKTDMLLRDIYGAGYGNIGLSAEVIASTFGKCQHAEFREFAPVAVNKMRSSAARKLRRQAESEAEDLCHDPCCCTCGVKRWNHFFDSFVPGVGEKEIYALARGNGVPSDSSSLMPNREEAEGPTEADVARSILTMTTYNLTQQAYMNSLLCDCKRIVMVGYFLEMPGYLSSIQHCIDFWSERQVTTIFVRSATNLGAFGAALRIRRRASGAHLTDIISDDRNPSPHRLVYHLKKALGEL